MTEVFKFHFFEKKKEYLEFDGLGDYKQNPNPDAFFDTYNPNGVSIQEILDLPPFDRWRLISYFLLEKKETFATENDFAEFVNPLDYDKDKIYFKWLKTDEIKSIHKDLEKIYGKNEITPQTSLSEAKIIVQKKEIGDAIKKIFVVGDIHSGLPSLMSVLTAFSDEEGNSIFKKDFTFDKNYAIMFTGDIMDRGLLSLECMFIIKEILNKNNGRVFLCRGNHETEGIMSQYGAKTEIFQEMEKPADFFGNLSRLFERLPQVVYLKINGKIYHFSHGSFEPLNLGEFNVFMGNDNEFGYIDVEKTTKGSHLQGLYYFNKQMYAGDEEFNKFEINFNQNLEEIKKIYNGKIESQPKEKRKRILENQMKRELKNLFDENDMWQYSSFSSFMWGDFSLENENKTGEDRGIIHGIKAVEEYKRKYNIAALITGHQDQYNLQIVPQFFDINQPKFLGNFEFIVGELFTPSFIFGKINSLFAENKIVDKKSKTAFQQLFQGEHVENSYYIITLKPEEFHVAILSNCGFSENRPYLVYNSFGEIIIKR